MLRLSLKTKTGAHNRPRLLIDSSIRAILISQRHAFLFQSTNIAAPDDSVLHKPPKDR